MTGSEKIRKKLSRADLSKAFLALVFISLILLPLMRMVFNIDRESLSDVLSTEAFYTALKNSAAVSLLSAFIAIIIAYFLASFLEGADIKGKSFFSTVLVLPMLIPSISHGMGLMLLFGNNGILTNLFHLERSIYGPVGIVTGSVMYAFPVAFLMISDILKYQDMQQYEAAACIGLGKFQQFKIITYPFLRKPMIAVTFAIFTMIVTDYGVPLMVGGKFITLPVIMYQEVIGQLNFGRGSVYGIFLLIPAVISFILDINNKDRGNESFVTRKTDMKKSKAYNSFAYFYCTMTTVLAVLPIFSFLLLAFAKKYPYDMSFTFDNVIETFSLGGGRYLANSVIMAFCTSLIGIVISFFTSYLTARMKSGMSGFLHLSVMTSAAIPGIVLGLAYVLCFKGTFIYGTIIILVMVNLVHFLSSPYLMMYNSMSKINENLESVGETLGLSRLNIIFHVFIPQNKRTVFEMFSYFFVNCMMTISAVSFLATTANKPIALMINQFEAQMQLEASAVVSLLILGTNIIVKLTVFFLNKRERKITL